LRMLDAKGAENEQLLGILTGLGVSSERNQQQLLQLLHQAREAADGNAAVAKQCQLEVVALLTTEAVGGMNSGREEECSLLRSIESKLDATRQSVVRVQASLEAAHLDVQRALTTVLAMANEEGLEYPTTFIVVPVLLASDAYRSLGEWLKAPGRWLNNETYMVVFLCGRTMRRVKYGDQEGLVFSVPMRAAAAAAGAGAAFWKEYGAVIKFGAALVAALVKATTGLSLTDVVPVDALGARASTAMGAVDFVKGYAGGAGTVLDGAGADSTWESIQPAEGVSAIVQVGEAGEEVLGESYRAFGKFLKQQRFDAKKLLDNGMVKRPVEDGDGGMSFAWVLEEDAAAEQDEAGTEAGALATPEQAAGAVTKEGTLKKRGRHWPYNWRERTFTLTGAALLQPVANSEAAKRALVFGPGCSVGEAAAGGNVPAHCFSVVGRHGQKPELLRASSAEEQAEWIDAVGGVMRAPAQPPFGAVDAHLQVSTGTPPPGLVPPVAKQPE
jgi:hypothetical protein